MNMTVKVINDGSIESRRWRHYEGKLTCPVCKSEFDDGIMEFLGDDVPKFCPDCGTDMRVLELSEEVFQRLVNNRS